MDTTTRQRIEQKIRQYPSHSNARISDLFPKPRPAASAVAAVRASIGVATPEPAAQISAPVSRVRVRDLSEFRRAHDIPQKIRDRLAALRPQAYVTEEELRQLCDVSVQHWRRNAELPEFAEHKFKHAGIVYWSRKETIREMKKITGCA